MLFDLQDCDHRLEDAYQRVFSPRPVHWKKIPAIRVPEVGVRSEPPNKELKLTKR